MSNTYTWTATNLIGYPQYEGHTDVVTTVFYTVTADDGAGHTASTTNVEIVPLPKDLPFIPYKDLTNDIVIGWVKDVIGTDGVTSIQLSLNAQIEAQINPPLAPVSLPLPWATTN